MFLGMLTAYLLGNVYIFMRFLQAMGRLFPFGRDMLVICKAVCAAVFWCAALSLFVSLFARDAGLPQWLLGGMYNVGSIWLVFTLYMVLALLAVDLLKLFWHNPFLKSYSTLAAFGLVSMLLLYGYINYRNPKVEEISIDLTNGASAAPSVDMTVDGLSSGAEPEGELSGNAVNRMRIVAVSDVHLGHATGKKALRRYVEKINSLNPDIILIGGDLIDNSVVPVEEQRMYEEISQLRAPMGIYMVPGNHEYISSHDLSEVKEFLKKTPVVLLQNKVVSLPGGLSLAGMDDRAVSRMSRDVYDRLRSEVGENRSILLVHQPSLVVPKDSLGFDIQFSGHTHRGQIWPVTMLVDRMYEQSHGYRKWGNSHVIVSSGLSLWGPPFRIGTNSDIWVINVEPGHRLALHSVTDCNANATSPELYNFKKSKKL